MPLRDNETKVLAKLIAWGFAEPLIRAILITSSRTRQDGLADLLSDYDIVLVVTDLERFRHDTAWQSFYGEIMVQWGDEGELLGTPTIFRGPIYEDYTKIDYTIWHTDLLLKISQEPQLPPELDVGYRVLLDKDGGTVSWKPPSYKAHIPKTPSATEYQRVIEEFWWTTTYVAKSLWRDDLVFARWVLDTDIRLNVMRIMLEWRIEIEHAWSVKPGVLGRGLKRLLPPDIWQELESTFVGAGIEENWEALWRMIALFHRVAIEVGSALEYSYPQQIEDKTSLYLKEIQALECKSNN